MWNDAEKMLQHVSDQTGYAVDWLRTSPNLEFDLDDSFDLDISHISFVMLMNRGVNHLFIGGMSIKDTRDAVFFAKALTQQFNLGSLYFERISFSSDSMEKISKSLNEIKSLNTLSFEQISFDSLRTKSKFVPIIAECLNYNRSITELHIKTTHSIRDVNPIGRALQHNNSLIHLDLSANSITSEGVKDIGQALRTNQTLKLIRMNDNHIGESGAKALVEGLMSNTVLQHLDISSNYIPTQLRNFEILHARSLDISHLDIIKTPQWSDQPPLYPKPNLIGL